VNDYKPIANPLAGIKVIDVDTHWSEPPDLWTSRAPASMRDSMPQRKVLDGQLRWMMGDKTIFILGAASVVAKDGSMAQDMGFAKWQVEDVHPACYDTKARTSLMDEEGVYAHVVYPNILGFGGQRAMMIEADHRLAATQIYNDALAEMQQESGQRIFGMALIPWWDVNLARTEIRRCAAMGLRGVNLNSAPHLNGLPDLADPYWDPMWEECVKHDLPINFHIGASDEAMDWIGTSGWPSMPEAKRMMVGSAMLTMDQVKLVVNFMISGILDRFPTMKVVSVESGIGWIPFFLNQLDYGIVFNPMKKIDMKLTPSEYFRRNFTACFWFENENLEHLIKTVGEDNVMFETDFPHPTCLYPSGLSRVTAALTDRRLLEKICSTTAARIYNIPI
jgi:predicted TIM-barrel fold metal-dependent hydrolase